MKKLLLCGIFSLLLAAAAGAMVRAPQNLNIIYVDGDTFTIVWDASPDTFTVSYKLYRSASAAVEPVILTSVANSYYTDDSVNTWTAFYYKVRAVSLQGENSQTTNARKSLPVVFDTGTLKTESRNSKVLVSWDLSANTVVAGYAVYRSSWAGNNFSRLAAVPAAQPQYLDTNAINGIDYEYKLAALDSTDGVLMPGAAAAPFAAPFAPKNITAVVTEDTGSNTVTLRLGWSADGIRGTYDVAHYDIYRNVTSPVADIAGVTNLYYDMTLVPKGARYYYKATAEDAMGNSSMPSYVSVYIPDGTVAAPYSLTCTSITSQRIELAWESLNDAEQMDGFRIYRDSAEIGTVSSDQYTDTTVTTGQPYNYHVTAYKGAVESAASNAIAVTITVGTPVILSVSQAGIGTLLPTWKNTAGENAVTFNIYGSYTPGVFVETPVTVTFTPSQETMTYIDSGLATGVARYYRITALSGVNESAYTEGHAMSITRPVSEITGLFGDAFNAYVNLTWTADPAFDLNYYTIHYRATTITAISPASVTTAATSKIINGLTSGVSYTFNVAGTNAAGAGVTQSANNLILIPSAALQLDKPENLFVDSPGNSSLALTWDAVNGAAQYRIYRSLNPGAVPDTIIATVTAASYADYRVYTENSYYSYKIEVINKQGTPEGVFSDVRGNSQFTRAGAPENMEINNTSGGIILSWSRPAAHFTYDSQLSYRIFRSSFAGGFDAALAETQSTYYWDMTANTLLASIYYRVRSIDGAGNTDAGTSIHSIAVSQPIEPPGVLLARPGDKRVTLTWKKVTPDYYNIYRSTDGMSFTSPIAYSIAFDGREYIDADPSLENKVRDYYYTIAAVNNGGEGPRSMTASAMPYAPPILTNAVVTCTAKDKKDVFINWTKADAAADGYGISAYNIYRSSDNGWTYSLVTTTPYLSGGGPDHVTIYTDTATQWDKTYTYLIKVEDAEGNLDKSYNPATIELPLPRNRLRVYANLVDLSKAQSLTWQYVLTKPGKLKVKVYTLSGSFVKQLEDTEYTGAASEMDPFQSPEMLWDGTNARGVKVASGVYILMLELDGEKSMHKVAVIK